MTMITKAGWVYSDLLHQSRTFTFHFSNALFNFIFRLTLSFLMWFLGFLVRSYDRSIAFCKRVLHECDVMLLLAVSSTRVSLRSSSSPWRLLSRLPFTSILRSISPSMCFRRQFLHKMWPVQLAFLYIVCNSFPPWPILTLRHFSRDRSNWSLFFFSTTF
jgi:hypothetical protein